MIPFMKKIVACFERLEGKNEQFLYAHCWCLHCTEQCELAVQDYESCENTLNKAVDLLRSKLGPNPEKYYLYGCLLHNLGNNYLLQNKPGGEASRLFTKAIIALEKAEDYDSEEKKKEIVKKSELALKIARSTSHVTE